MKPIVTNGFFVLTASTQGQALLNAVEPEVSREPKTERKEGTL
jgi:hypothetical protein